MQLLLDNPLWIVILVVTIALHVVFYFVIRHLSRLSRPKGEVQSHEATVQGDEPGA
ncbi:MAG: hypothetical protein AB1766_10410 [Pseudomonadota bacterium]